MSNAIFPTIIFFTSYAPGAVTVFALKLSPDVTKSLTFSDQLSGKDVDLYLMTADAPEDVLSKYAWLFFWKCH